MKEEKILDASTPDPSVEVPDGAVQKLTYGIEGGKLDVGVENEKEYFRTIVKIHLDYIDRLKIVFTGRVDFTITHSCQKNPGNVSSDTELNVIAPVFMGWFRKKMGGVSNELT